MKLDGAVSAKLASTANVSTTGRASRMNLYTMYLPKMTGHRWLALMMRPIGALLIHELT